MRIDRLVLRHFRNHEQTDITPGAGVNLFEGENAQGKTSLLEALYLCMTGRSFRCHQLKPLLQEGSSFFSVELHFTKRGIPQRLRLTFDGSERTILHNDALCSGTAELLGILQGVVLSMADMQLIKGAPQQRRQFIDLHLAQSNPNYIRHLARYNRAMRQRNHQLRGHSLDGIDVWEQEMARSGAYLANEREKAISLLSKQAGKRYSTIAEEETLQLTYKTQAPVSEGLEEVQSFYCSRFRELREKEAIIGSSLSGPHRDDVTISVESRKGKEFASEGQQYGCVAALRLAEWDCLKNNLGYLPILLIDDIGLPLDADRKHKLFSQLAELGQIFISSPHAMDNTAHIKESTRFFINQGQVRTQS